MGLEQITTAYKFVDCEIAPDQLLLDPNNPRLITDPGEERKYSLSQIMSEDIQRLVLHKVCQSEHHVSRLIDGIRRTGFMPGASAMIVKRLREEGRFLVIEGNRRTAAVKHLLKAPDGLSADVLRTLDRLPVKELIHNPESAFDEEEVIDVILGTIHIEGPEAWGPMQKAHYIYKTYCRELARRTGREAFRYTGRIARDVGETFNCKPTEVKRHLTVYQVYRQLKEGDYGAHPDHYSLIEMATKTKGIREGYFGIDPHSLGMSQEGLDRFDQLCLVDSPPVKNPVDFRAFRFIYEHGAAYEIPRAESGEVPLQALKRRIEERQGKAAFLAELHEIRRSLGALTFSAFRGTREESKEIMRIKEMVDNRLLALVSDEDASASSDGVATRRSMPHNIDEALQLNIDHICGWIESVLKKRPNQTCMRTKLPAYLLQTWGVRSRATPRAKFDALVERAVKKLLGEERIDAYRAKNERLRLL